MSLTTTDKRNCVALYSAVGAVTIGAEGDTGALNVGPYTEVAIDVSTSANTGTNPTLQFYWDRLGADGNYYNIWQSSLLSAAVNILSLSIGSGVSYAQSLGATGRLRWNIGGTATPTWTINVSVQAK